jgi:hypothetical protein
MVKKIALAGVFALAATAAYAGPNVQLASLASVDGKILVNQGHGYVAAKPGMMLSDGDRVIALDGASAAVVYADGCVTKLKENNVLAMSQAAGCKEQPLGTGQAAPIQVAQAIGGPAQSLHVTQAPIGGDSAGGGGVVGGPVYVPVLIGGGLGIGLMMGDSYSNHGTHSVSPR